MRSTRRTSPIGSRPTRSTPSTSGGCDVGELLSGAQILCRVLVEEGVDTIWGYPGGAIMPFYHALPDVPEIRHILVRHEQAAAHAADGYARASGRIGVCVATSGPGATNLVTGLATAQMDSSPVVAITGQVPRAMLGRDAFQETDVVGITLPITKHSCLVADVTELADRMREAIAIAREGRPGPVLIDVPKDVQNQKTEYREPEPRLTPGVSPGITEEGVLAAARLIAAAERPLLMVGHGVVLSGAYDAVRQLAEKTGMPVITTLLGISALPASHPLHLGMPGMHGEVHVNRAIQRADVIVGIGLRFDDRVTGNTKGFAPRAKIIHVDLDASEIGKNVPVARRCLGDLRGRRVPDEHAGDRDDGAGAHPGEAGRVQQRLPRDGAAVAAVLPREALLGDAHLEPGLREAGGGLRHPRMARGPRERARAGPGARQRGRGAGAGGIRDRAGSERVPDDPARRHALRADRSGAGGRGERLSVTMVYALSLVVDQELLALGRAFGELRRRNLNVSAITLGPGAAAGQARLTVIVDADEGTVEMAMRKLLKVSGVRGATHEPQ